MTGLKELSSMIGIKNTVMSSRLLVGKCQYATVVSEKSTWPLEIVVALRCFSYVKNED